MRKQEELQCRRCGAPPESQCITSYGTFSRYPHLERYDDAGLASSAEATNRVRKRANNSKRRAAIRVALKQQVLKHYGEACACCGATEKLVIDHIKGLGSGDRHRREIGRAPVATHAWLIKNNFPLGFQTLCTSCNRSKHSGPYCLLHNQPGYEGVIAIIRTVRPGGLAVIRSERLAA